MERFSAVLEVKKGVTAIIGSGGKTSLLRRLGAELEGRVILCTTTRIWPFDHVPVLLDPTADQVERDFRKSGVLCLGSHRDDGKLGPPALSMAALAQLADYVLVEADGAAGLPLKAHASWEPVIPPESGQVIQVVGASGIGQIIRTVAHRPERYAALTETAEDAVVTPAMAARVIKREGLCSRVLVNQADRAEEAARALAAAAHVPAAAGSLQKGSILCWF